MTRHAAIDTAIDLAIDTAIEGPVCEEFISEES
jgi:hypothetical protein